MDDSRPNVIAVAGKPSKAHAGYLRNPSRNPPEPRRTAIADPDPATNLCCATGTKKRRKNE